MSLRVDLKSQEVKRGVSFDYQWILVVVAVVVAFIGFYLGNLKLQSVIDARKKELKQWDDKVAGFSGIQGKLENLKREIATIQSQIRQLRELRYDPLRYSILLVRVTQILPDNVWLTNMSIDPSRTQVTMSATALTLPGHPPLAGIAQLIMNLQNDKNSYFSDVIMGGTSGSSSSNTSGAPPDTWTFNLTFNYNIPLIASNEGAPAAGTPAAPPPVPTPAVAPPSPGAVTPKSMPPATAPSGQKSPAPAPTSQKQPVKPPEQKPPAEKKGGKH